MKKVLFLILVMCFMVASVALVYAQKGNLITSSPSANTAIPPPAKPIISPSAKAVVVERIVFDLNKINTAFSSLGNSAYIIDNKGALRLTTLGIKAIAISAKGGLVMEDVPEDDPTDTCNCTTICDKNGCETTCVNCGG